MRNPFSRRRRFSERIEVDLGARPTGTRDGRAAHGADRLRHLGFAQPFTEPDPAALHVEVASLVAQAAARGAFDEGSAAFVDQRIFALRDGWLALVESEHQQRLDVARWILAARRENQVVAIQTLHRLQTLRAGVDADVDRHRAALAGEESDGIPASPAPPQLTAIRAVGDDDDEATVASRS